MIGRSPAPIRRPRCSITRGIGAANTLTFAGGRIQAENTDASAILAALPRPPEGMRALVMGAGGSARAAVWALQRAGAATMLLDDELDGRVLADRIGWLLSDDERLRSMGERARAWSKPDAANALARTVIAAGDGG